MITNQVRDNRVASTYAFGLFMILVSSGLSADETIRPNILLIVTDDQGYWDLGVHGNERIDTPRLDQMARESVRFDRFYVQPVCAPTRAGLMTGRYYLRSGLYNTRFGGDSLGLGEITVAAIASPSRLVLSCVLASFSLTVASSVLVAVSSAFAASHSRLVRSCAA